MTLTITIECDNAAFEIESGTLEVARILRELADTCEGRANLYDFGDTKIRDVNGNGVGRVSFHS